MVPENRNRTSVTWRALPKFLAVVFYVAAISVLPSFAKTHPVPLDKNVDAKKCLECHEDKSKGRAVHSAIATGCMSCHEVRVSRDVTRVKLMTTTTQALCLSCHDEKKVQAGQTMHPPAVRDCVKCHDPHQSDNPNQLLKATSGTTRDENLCLSCHKVGVDVQIGRASCRE